VVAAWSYNLTISAKIIIFWDFSQWWFNKNVLIWHLATRIKVGNIIIGPGPQVLRWQLGHDIFIGPPCIPTVLKELM
jgi:hypothetical protein